MRYFLIFSILNFFSLSISAQEACKLPEGVSLTVGCTTKCKYFYRRALRKAADYLGYPIKIINMYNEEHSINFESVDALVNPGGADINPKYYKDKVEDDLRELLNSMDHLVNYSLEGKRRDPFEYKLWQQYFSSAETQELPALGICRGMQMMAVSQKVPLYIDINKELGIRNRRYIFDKVDLNKDEKSRFSEVLGFTHLWAYKQHHQGVRVDYFHKNKERWPHLKISSYSHKGKIAESLEADNRPALGVQFHPEMDWGSERLKIFSWLLEKGCENKNRKMEQKG